MEKCIIDPNRKGRMALYAVSALAFIPVMVYYLYGKNGLLGPIAFVVAFLTIPMASLDKPHVVLSPEGVVVRAVWTRKTLYPWKDLFQAGIIRSGAKRGGNEWLFPIVLLLPGAASIGTEKKNALLTPNWNRQVILPNTKEIREYVLTHYGPLDFNDIEKLNEWEKKYYHFD